MNIPQKIINQGLTVDGGTYRQLPLFTLSCAGHGYGMLVQKITGVSYGTIGGIGSQKGWQSLFNMRHIV